MKLFKFGMRFWITLTSVFSFLVGWIMLAHSPKPVEASAAQPSSSVSPLPTLAPLQPLNFSNNGGIQQQQFSVIPPAPPAQSFFSPAPVFSTGGS
jgi:hypothetical protein